MVDEDALERRLSAFRHEAATPVALITAALHVLERDHAGDDDVAALIDRALRQAEVLQRLLDQLRGAGPGELVPDLAALDLATLAEQVVEDLGATILAGRTCHVHVPDHPVTIDGDAPLLRQLLTNLLDNAVKYTPSDTSIHVVVSHREGEAELAVTDEGDGIAPTDLQRIFRRYERADEDGEGLGLGLYIVWRVASAHGGWVRAEPAPSGQGSRFVVTLPA